MKKEIWKQIDSHPDYQVSNLGRVKSLKFGKERILKPANSTGYSLVDIDGETKSVHRLVALAFIPNPEGKSEVNHIDEDGLNNCANNLEWLTHEENVNHGTRNERASKANKGQKRSEDFKRRMSEYKKGNQNLLGFKHSEEAKRKISESTKAYWAKKKEGELK